MRITRNCKQFRGFTNLYTLQITTANAFLFFNSWLVAMSNSAIQDSNRRLPTHDSRLTTQS
jgi:hypothetical protein